MATDIKISDVMKKPVITISKDSTAADAAKIMAKARIGGIIIADKGRVEGILTEGDLIRDVLAKGKNYKTVKVKSIMKFPVKAVYEETDLEEAVKMMRDKKIERLPVINRKKLLTGIVTERDITRIQPALLELVRGKEALQIKIPRGIGGFSGMCESCYNYSENLTKVGNELLCEECMKGE